jgi:hypothetical protein
MMRDALAQYLQIEYMDVDYQAYRPVIVFINGAYWGIHNMREKINEHYLAENYGVDPDDVNILQGGGNAAIGKSDEYLAMIDFVSNNDMSDPKNYAYIRKKMDVEQYIDYQIANIYMAESDWPGNNIKFWNTNRLANNKWRWIMFDRDGSLRSYRTETDELTIATATDGTGWPNPPWSTLLLRRLLTNETFRHTFIQIFAYQMNTTFDPGRLYDMIDEFNARIKREIPRHIGRWGGQVDPEMNESWRPGPTFNSVPEWEDNVNQMKDFVRRRPPYAIRHINKKFGINGTALVEIDVNDSKAGVAKIYHKKIPEGGYSGNHFKDVPLVIRAVTYPGHKFLHWIYSGPDGQKTIEKAEIELELTGPVSLIAYFSDELTDTTPAVLINEINYHSSQASDPGDWVELHNNRGDFIDLSNWILKDDNDDHESIFRDGFELEPYGYIVVCENMDDFKSIFPEVDNITGDLGFKLSNGGEVIRLYDNNGKLIDSVRYDDKDPWPESPDGNGPTLELIHPDLNNDLPGSWASSFDLGTPGRLNHTITGLPSEMSNPNKGTELFNIYPHPVSTSATITYYLKNSGQVLLRVMSLTGQEVTTIVNRYQHTNTYALRFDASQLPNGIYLYILEVNGSFIEAKRMIVVH